MIVTTNDEKKYFKSLLLLIGKNKIISTKEKEFLMNTCDMLGFKGNFCKDEIENSYDHNYVIDEPPRFSDQSIAKILLKDGIRITMVDKEPHIYELYWLRRIAKKNEIPDDWLAEELYRFLNSKDAGNGQILEIQRYLKNKYQVKHS